MVIRGVAILMEQVMQTTFSDILESNFQNVVHTLYTSSVLLICYSY